MSWPTRERCDGYVPLRALSDVQDWRADVAEFWAFCNMSSSSECTETAGPSKSAQGCDSLIRNYQGKDSFVTNDLMLPGDSVVNFVG